MAHYGSVVRPAPAAPADAESPPRGRGALRLAAAGSVLLATLALASRAGAAATRGPASLLSAATDDDMTENGTLTFDAHNSDYPEVVSKRTRELYGVREPRYVKPTLRAPCLHLFSHLARPATRNDAVRPGCRALPHDGLRCIEPAAAPPLLVAAPLEPHPNVQRVGRAHARRSSQEGAFARRHARVRRRDPPRLAGDTVDRDRGCCTTSRRSAAACLTRLASD